MTLSTSAKLTIVFSVLSLGLLVLGVQLYFSDRSPEKEKLYVALEGEGKIAVMDRLKGEVVSRISLRERKGMNVVNYMPHNVQVAPNGLSVWVTANVMTKAGMDGGHEEKVEDKHSSDQDQVIVIDPRKDRIVKRIALGTDQHLTHVVVSNVGDYAYALSQDKGVLYQIDAVSYGIRQRIELGQDSGPHGLRLSSDGTKAFVAFMDGKGMGIVDTATGAVERLDLLGTAVQTAVTPDGKYVVVSIYDKKQVAIYQIETKRLSFVDLPSEARGPVQLYSTPDSLNVYVADQGYYFNQPTSEWVYKVDLMLGKVVQTVKAGQGPHGIVLSDDGRYAYVTNIVSDDVSVIDLQDGREVQRIKVGDMPNGISIWSMDTTRTPQSQQ